MTLAVASLGDWLLAAVVFVVAPLGAVELHCWQERRARRLTAEEVRRWQR